MLDKNFKKTYIFEENSKYGCQYVVSFCTKYKRNIFKEKDFEVLKNSFVDTSNKHDFLIHNMDISANNVTLVVECSPTFGIKNVVIKLKKDSKDALRKHDASFRTKIPCIWTREAFISTIGKVSETDIKEFVDAQETYSESISKNKKEKEN